MVIFIKKELLELFIIGQKTSTLFVYDKKL